MLSLKDKNIHHHPDSPFRVDVLVNNAGLMACPLTRFTLKALNLFAMRKLCLSFTSPSQPDQMENPLFRSSEGHELQFATNHLGPFLLTNMLLPLLRAAPTAR